MKPIEFNKFERSKSILFLSTVNYFNLAVLTVTALVYVLNRYLKEN